MSFIFLDNNILIGYCFKQDDQKPYSENALDCNASKYWSKSVLKEFNRVKIRKLDELSGFLCRVSSFLKDLSKDLSMLELSRLISTLGYESFNENSIKIIINDIWDNGNFEETEPIETIIKYLKDYYRVFKKEVAGNEKRCRDALEYHERNNNFPSHEKILKKCVDGRDNLINPEYDLDICLDAHDLVISKNINPLFFITDDRKLFACKDLIESNTKIREVCFLRDHNFQNY